MVTSDTRRLRRIALRTVLIYTVVSGLWILTSDRIAASLIRDHAQLAWISITKGWFFVAVTSALLFSYLSRQLRRVEIEVEARRRSASELSDQRRRLDSIIEGTRVGTWEWNVQTGQLVLNERWAAMVGYTLSELAPLTILTWERLAHPDDLEMSRQLLQRHFDGEADYYDLECRMRHKSGRWIWIQDRGRVQTRDADGKPLMMFGTHTDITARKEAELAVRESESRFRAVVESSPTAIFIGNHGRFAYANAATARLFGVSIAQDLVGREVLDFIHPSGRAAAAERIRRVCEFGEAQPAMVHHVVQPGGGVRLAETTGVPFEFGGRAGALVFARDVTEERMAEEKLRLHEAVLRETGEIAKVGGWSFDPETGEGFWTDEVARIHDMDPAAVVSRDDGLRFYQGESRTRIEAALKAAVEEGKPYDLELELVTEAGRHKWVRTIGHPVVENGRVVRVRGSFQDVTEMHAASEALRESEARFRQLAENIDGVFWITEGGATEARVIYVSPAYETVWGRSREALLRGDYSWSDAIHPDDRARVLRALETKMFAGNYVETYRIVQPSGAVRWIHDRAFPLATEAGRTQRVVGIAEDITERRNLEEQFRQAQKMQAIGTLAGGIAHDFNNLLGAINGFAEVTRTQVRDRPDACENIDDILRAGKRAISLVRQILAFSRRTPSERVLMQVRPIADEAVRLLRSTIPTTIEIVCEVRRDVPPIVADPTQIHQVIMNLGTNAWHAIRGSSGRIEVKFERREIMADHVHREPRLRAGVFACITVRDTGTGITPEVMERMFEPFFTTKAPGDGTGLGLSVVHGIMREHEGFITVDSTLGVGSEFRLHFPAADTEAATSAADVPVVAKGRGERVLFVDDEPALVRLGVSMLKEIGYHAEGAEGVQAALAIVAQQDHVIDVIVTDYTMPIMTGVALARAVHVVRPNVPVIVVTGHAGDLTRAQLDEQGVSDLLIKPLSLGSLAVSVRSALDRRLKYDTVR